MKVEKLVNCCFWLRNLEETLEFLVQMSETKRVQCHESLQEAGRVNQFRFHFELVESFAVIVRVKLYIF
jgi:hypothetical protein